MNRRELVKVGLVDCPRCRAALATVRDERYLTHPTVLAFAERHDAQIVNEGVPPVVECVACGQPIRILEGGPSAN